MGQRTVALLALMEKKGMVSIRQASKLAMVTTETIRDWIYTGKLVGSIYYAGRWWVPEGEVKKIIAVLVGGGPQ